LLTRAYAPVAAANGMKGMKGTIWPKFVAGFDCD